MKPNRILSIFLSCLLILSLAVPALAEQNPDCGAKLIAITFDDGPGIYTDRLLDGLADRNAKATFFVAGYRAVEYPEVLQRIVDEGHQLANHTYNHKNLNTLSAEGVQKEVKSTRDLLVEVGGEQTYFIRPPYGNANSTVQANAGAPLIIWSVDPVDWDNFNADTVCNNIVKGSFDGGIILVHDIYKTSVNGALAAIDILQARGYEFVTVEELLLRRGVTPENGKLYYMAKNQGVNLSKWQISDEYFDEDLMNTFWAKDALEYCVSNGFFEPDERGTYLPNVRMTRAELVTALGRFCGVAADYGAEAPCAFTDVAPDAVVLPYLKWGYDMGVIQGANGLFSPDDFLTREQMCCILERYLTGLGLFSQPEDTDLTVFPDTADISWWAEQSVRFCVGNGILVGTPNGFDPSGSLTRAQVATILQRLMNA